ncbi:MAG: D-alanyl-D-alanine carboxypeptidase/D-alanyl-D-alanine-endopeptidase [Ignavibacteriae bacterium HGW-Ignavibacteriae-3]|nr:MAG: D-alanyl-D-alanine carboxypeptidase/D-alanyl-D-alanine-endopeptidase [Ignavibacteriae bacterium HGW-Ignavibacteriae-3]
MFKKLLIIVPFLLLSQACSTFRQDVHLKQDPLDTLLNSDLFNSSQISLSVFDLTDNKPVLSRNEKLLLRPASNQKILTTAAAYLFLGNEFKFKTSVYHSGEIKDSVCSGDVYIIGGFDPDFTSGDLDSFIRGIRHFGIKKIEGNLYADVSAMDSLIFGKGWMWDDDPGTYSPYLTPLCINKNSIGIAYEPDIPGNPAKIKLVPETDFFPIENSSVTIQKGKSNFLLTRDWINRNNTLIVSGSISKNAKRDTVYVNVFNPTFYFLNLMKESLARNGIEFSGKIDTLTMIGETKEIFSLKRDLNSVIINTNKVSDNLSAEMLLRTLAFNSTGKHASAERGIKFVDSLITLSGLNPKNYRIVDGSGLSNYNLLSAELITEVLKYFYYKQPLLFTKLYESFPISGFDGTLSSRMNNSVIYKKVHAKTGTISGVSSLSGYIESSNNHLIAFSILIQNFTGGAGKARAVQDEICRIIYETN